MRFCLPRPLALLLVAALVMAGCGGGDDDDASETPSSGDATATAATGTTPGATTAPGQPTGAATQPGTADPAATATLDTSRVLTPEEIQQYKPNELGQIPILEWHQLGSPPEQFIRTPEQFRGDLQRLYENNFYVISLRDFLDFNINVPAGKKPVIFTFDDSEVDQFKLIPVENNQLAIDPNSAIGIMEEFFNTHPDFGRGGVFGILPQQLFNWPDGLDQNAYGEIKINWLLDHGYEISNHSYDHVNLGEIPDDEIKYQLAAANDFVQAIRPDAEILSITLPFGIYPIGPNGPGDDTLLRGFDYNGKSYSWRTALQVGANPTVVPISTEYDAYAVARIQAFDEELDKWFGVFAENPGLLYVSDGNPNTVTIPNELHPWLAGTLDESKLGGKQLIRY